MVRIRRREGQKSSGELYLKDVAIHSHPEYIDALAPGFRLQEQGELVPELDLAVRDQES